MHVYVLDGIRSFLCGRRFAKPTEQPAAVPLAAAGGGGASYRHSQRRQRWPLQPLQSSPHSRRPGGAQCRASDHACSSRIRLAIFDRMCQINVLGAAKNPHSSLYTAQPTWT